MNIKQLESALMNASKIQIDQFIYTVDGYDPKSKVLRAFIVNLDYNEIDEFDFKLQNFLETQYVKIWTHTPTLTLGEIEYDEKTCAPIW